MCIIWIMIKTDFDIAIDLNSIMYSESTGIVKTLTPGKGPSGFIFDLDSKSDISPESLKRIWGCPGCHLNMDNRPLPLQGCTAPYEMALAPDPQDKTSSQQIVKRVSVVHKEHPYTEIVV